MKILFKYIKKNIPVFVVLTVLLVIGVVFLVASERQINSQKAQIALLQKTIKNNSDQIGILSSENSSKSAQIKTLLDQPKPTPQVKYVTQYQTVTETAPKQTVTYYPVGNTGQSYGSDGSWCYPNGNSVYCTGGH